MRIAFWTVAADAAGMLADHAWIDYQRAKRTHDNPMAANRRYLTAHRWACAANLKLTAVRMAP